MIPLEHCAENDVGVTCHGWTKSNKLSPLKIQISFKHLHLMIFWLFNQCLDSVPMASRLSDAFPRLPCFWPQNGSTHFPPAGRIFYRAKVHIIKISLIRHFMFGSQSKLLGACLIPMWTKECFWNVPNAWFCLNLRSHWARWAWCTVFSVFGNTRPTLADPNY